MYSDVLTCHLEKIVRKISMQLREDVGVFSSLNTWRAFCFCKTLFCSVLFIYCPTHLWRTALVECSVFLGLFSTHKNIVFIPVILYLLFYTCSFRLLNLYKLQSACGWLRATRDMLDVTLCIDNLCFLLFC